MNYGGMPKSERPKSGKRQNQNFCWFGFRHVPISDAWALKFPRNLSEIGTFSYQQFGLKLSNFGPNCPKSEPFSWDFIRFWAFVEKRAVCPICLFNSLAFRRSKMAKSKQNCSDFGQCPNNEPSGIGPKVDSL